MIYRVTYLIPCPIWAKVAELVDAQDLGSCGFMPWGFESPLSHLRPVEGVQRVAHRVLVRVQTRNDDEA